MAREPLFEGVSCAAIVCVVLILHGHSSRVSESFGKTLSTHRARGSLAVAARFQLPTCISHLPVVARDVAGNVAGTRVGQANSVPVEKLMPVCSFWEVFVKDFQENFPNICFHLEVVWGVVPECVGVSLFSLRWVGCSCLAFVLQGDSITTPGKALFIKSFVFLEDCFIGAAVVQSVFNVGWEVFCYCPWVV